jgi:hypothetical protein
MAQSPIAESLLKKLLKEALVEVLDEQRDLLYEVFAEVLEDFMLAQVLKEGEGAEPDQGEHFFAVMEGKA